MRSKEGFERVTSEQKPELGKRASRKNSMCSGLEVGMSLVKSKVRTKVVCLENREVGTWKIKGKVQRPEHQGQGRVWISPLER